MGKISFQVIQTSLCQEVPSVILCVDSKKLIFNVPETLQRFLTQHKIKFSKGSHIFFTRLSTRHISGLFGMMLTLFETKLCDETKIYGPPGTSSFFKSLKFMIGQKTFLYSSYDFYTGSKLLGLRNWDTFNKLSSERRLYDLNFEKEFKGREKEEINDASEFIISEDTYNNENIIIKPIKMQKDLRTNFEEQVSSISFGNNKSDLDFHLSYIVIVKGSKGNINKKKLEELKVPKNLMSDFFKKGEVEHNGKVIRVDDLRENENPDSSILVLDCPSEGFLDGLCNNPVIRGYFELKNQSNQLLCIIHLTPLEVLETQKYQEFIQMFGKACQHIIVSDKIAKYLLENNTELVSSKPYKHYFLNKILSQYFPETFTSLKKITFCQNFVELKRSKMQAHFRDIKEILPSVELDKKHLPLRNFEFIITPAKSVGYKALDNIIEDSKSLAKFEESEELKRKIEKLKEFSKSLESRDPSDMLSFRIIKGFDPKIVFLGTGSMIPSSYRNVSAIYLEYPQEKGDPCGILLDCGEGTYFQLYNQYGRDKINAVLENLRIIFISHIHADHHLGLLQIVYERKKIVKGSSKLFLVIPYNLTAWLKKYSDEIEELDIIIVYSQMLSNGPLETESNKEKKNIEQGLAKKSPIFKSGTDKSPSKSPIRSANINNEKNINISKHCNNENDEFENEFLYCEDPTLLTVPQVLEGTTENNNACFKMFLSDVGLKNFEPFEVDHCPQSFGILIEHEKGIKIVYSGDTRPCDNLIRKANGADILIHEATFNDGLLDKAKNNKHSTIREAVEVAIKAKVWRLVLTHFSQRYSKMGLTVKEKADIKKSNKDYYSFLKENTVVAFDHMNTNLSQYWKLPKITSCAICLLPNED